MTLKELKKVLDMSSKICVVDHDGDGIPVKVSCRSAVEYFKDHSDDTVTFITYGNGIEQITIFTMEAVK